MVFQGCSPEFWAAYQGILLNLGASGADSAIRQINSEAVWADSNDVARLVLSVAGSRDNWTDLIDFMTLPGETRGYSTVFECACSVEGVISGAPLVDQVLSAIVRAGEFDPVQAAIRDPMTDSIGRIYARAIEKEIVRADVFAPLRAALLELRESTAGVHPLGSLRAAASRKGAGLRGIADVRAFVKAKESSPSPAWLKAVDEAGAIPFPVEPVVAAVKAAVNSGPEVDLASAIKSALDDVLEPLRITLIEIKSGVDECNGFGVLDDDGEPGSALEVFCLRWKAFRGASDPEEVDEMAAAILAGDVPKLGELISWRNAAEIQIERKALPLELRRRTKGRAGLLDVAATVGGAPLRYLLEFVRLKPTIETLRQAVATGEPDLIRPIWDRLREDIRAKRVGDLAIHGCGFPPPRRRDVAADRPAAPRTVGGTRR
jgi:hypothetical protein